MKQTDRIPEGSLSWILLDRLIGNFLYLFWFGVVTLLFSFAWWIAMLFVVTSIVAYTIARVSGR